MKREIGIALMAMGLVAAAGTDAAKGPKVGDPAPAFSLAGSDGKTYTLDQFKGKQAVVIAWFPKAFTGGCTAECKSLHTTGETIRNFDVAYFTASVDDAETNKKFATSLELDYPILSDPGKEVARAYGVLQPEGYAIRYTYYIGKDGRVLLIDDKVNPATAGEDLAKHLGDLKIPKRQK